MINKNEIIIECINAVYTPTDARNSMGCSENWYNSYYALGTVFGEDELSKMSEKEIHNLLRLANAISEALY